MFYSQFILAKKGPLGTIWIAAHLERKLRKNQVADTDIGVSVDSILFPEVPIALRLSSHLLLGVVRIYSRKVNYLFHDCSEALLKIKQAFRSTAVDLPPEESTAPYHSITLPETFHLDDFELPDSAVQGDFVDHHVSTKEQITLQDTMDGMGYSSLQFGFDERFGDGNASQIGLDLDEDLFLEDNHPSSQLASSTMAPYERAVHQGQSSSSVPPTQMDIDDDQVGLAEEIDVEASKELCELPNSHDTHIHSSMYFMKKSDISSQCEGYNIQTPDLNEVFSSNDHVEGPSAAPSQSFVGLTTVGVPTPDLAECAHAPSTPGLMEEFSGNIHDGPALSPEQKPSPSIGEEAMKPEDSNLHFGHPDLVTDESVKDGVSVIPDSANSMKVVSSLTSESSEQREQITATDETQMGCGQKSVSVLQNGYIYSEVEELTVDERVQDNGEAILSEAAQVEGTSKLSSETIPACGKTSATYSSSCEIEVLPSNCSIEHTNPCLNGDATALSSDLHLRSCTSQINQANELSAQDGTSAQNASGGLVEEPGLPSQTSVQENKLHVSESSVEVQAAELEVQEKPHDVLTESALDVSNTNELLIDLSQKDTQRNQLNYSSSSEFPEPEKMLLAPTGDVEQANDLSQVTEEKGIIESDGSVNRITSLSGKKRHPTETTSALQNDNSEKMSGRSRFKRNTEYVPDDDDLLASILVGKRTPLLRIGPTPPPKATSLKRPRLAPRLGMLKRKVLLDDTTVLHADAIRQQLMNTEDIRRMRKKAPCTRPEIWLIQKTSLEDEMFNEHVITGISAKLNDLHTRTYDSEINQNNSSDEPPRQSDLSRSLEFDREANKIETAELISVTPEFVDGEMQGPSRVSLTNEIMAIDSTADEISLNDTINATAIPERNDHINTHSLQQSVDDMVQIGDDSSVMNNEARHFTKNASAVNLAFADGDSKDSMVDNNAVDANTLNDPQDVSAVTEGVNGEALVSELDNIFHESEAGLLTDPSSIICKRNISFQDDIIMESGGATEASPVTGNRVMDEGVLGVKVANEDLVQKLMHNEGNPNSDVIWSERPEMVSLSPIQTNTESENVPSAVGENSSLQEFNPEAGMVVESSPMDSAIAKECSDFCSTIAGNDTEFLNVDDEADYHEEGDNDVPNADDASLENSGWSSRTRGVARYLKILFDDESGHGRKSVAMNHLIAGKTRKEASRMFFETLVLKTKDYIHVEQEDPSDYIIIKPRSKLLKAEF